MNIIKLTLPVTFLAICCFVLPVVTGNAAEPVTPDVSAVFDADREKQILEIARLSAHDAFVRLGEPDVMSDDKFLNKAIYKAFENRKAEGISLALNSLSGPVIGIHDGIVVSRQNGLFIAKKIFQAFPVDATRKLVMLYGRGDAVTKGNVIRASDAIAGGRAVRNLLIRALDNRAFCEEQTDETLGEPMRVSDVAYNQLVLRYRIKNVLRTIGPSHSLEVRDYHIALLKGML